MTSRSMTDRLGLVVGALGNVLRLLGLLVGFAATSLAGRRLNRRLRVGICAIDSSSEVGESTPR
jgi:hypothetical protein